MNRSSIACCIVYLWNGRCARPAKLVGSASSNISSVLRFRRRSEHNVARVREPVLH